MTKAALLIARALDPSATCAVDNPQDYSITTEGQVSHYVDECRKALQAAADTIDAASSLPEFFQLVGDYIGAVDAYYRQYPSDETAGEKCVDLVLIEERLIKSLEKLQ